MDKDLCKAFVTFGERLSSVPEVVGPKFFSGHPYRMALDFHDGTLRPRSWSSWTAYGYGEQDGSSSTDSRLDTPAAVDVLRSVAIA